MDKYELRHEIADRCGINRYEKGPFNKEQLRRIIKCMVGIDPQPATEMQYRNQVRIFTHREANERTNLTHANLEDVLEILEQ